MNTLPYIFISLLAGVIVPLQLAIVRAFENNTQASQIQSTFVLYGGGTIASFVLASILSGGIKPPSIEHASWWMWLPGFLGSLYILFMFISAPKIGSANTLLWVFLGQMYVATFLSQTGWFGLPTQAVNPVKLLGLCVVTIGGLIMIYAETSK